MPLLLQGLTIVDSLLYSQPKCVLRRLQNVLNNAARLFHRTSRHEHITPYLASLVTY